MAPDPPHINVPNFVDPLKEIDIVPPSGGNAERRRQHALILAFLHWLKESKGGEIWTPDSWADCGMSPDGCTARSRVDQFLCYESEKNG